MLVNAPIFGKFMSMLGIRENVALTKVDLSRAIPVIPLDLALLAERATYQTFVHISTQVAAAAVALDPRSVNNWDTIFTNNREFVAGAGQIAVPADHDYRILSVGGTNDSAVTLMFRRAVTATAGASLQSIWFGADRVSEVYHNDTSPTIQNSASALFSPAFDPSTTEILVSGAGDLTFMIGVVSAPPGILKPY